MTFLYRWLPQALIISVLSLLIYAAVQQNYRQSLNDPQVGIAEDTAAALSRGASPESLLPQGTIDISSSLSTWLVIYDSSGRPIAGSAELNGQLPNMTQGIFDTAKWNGLIIGHHFNSQPADENRFSWQPRPDVRQAVVLVQASNGMFVAAGRNMREVELREQRLFEMVATVCGFLMLTTFLWEFLWVRFFHKT